MAAMAAMVVCPNSSWSSWYSHSPACCAPIFSMISRFYLQPWQRQQQICRLWIDQPSPIVMGRVLWFFVWKRGIRFLTRNLILCRVSKVDHFLLMLFFFSTVKLNLRLSGQQWWRVRQMNLNLLFSHNILTLISGFHASFYAKKSLLKSHGFLWFLLGCSHH